MSKKEDLVEYVKTFEECSEVLIEKVETIYEIAVKLSPDEIEDFVITEYRTKDGVRQFDSLWLFTSKYMLESKKILKKEVDLDIVCVYRAIDRLEISANNFNFCEASEESVLIISGNINNIVFSLRTSSINCDKLWDIFIKRLKENLVVYVDIE